MGWKSKPESSVSHCGLRRFKEKGKMGPRGTKSTMSTPNSFPNTDWVLFVHLFYCNFLLWVLLCSPGRPGTCYICPTSPKIKSVSPCLSFLSTRIKGICYHGWLQTKFYWRSEIIIIKSRSLDLTCLTLSVYLKMTMNILLSPLPRAGVTGMCPTCWGDRHVSLHLLMQCWEWNPG